MASWDVMRPLPLLALVAVSVAFASNAAAQPKADPDLVKLGESLLPTTPAPAAGGAKAAVRAVDAGAPDAGAATGPDASAAAVAVDTDADAGTATSPNASGAVHDDAGPEDAGTARDAGLEAGADVSSTRDTPAPARAPIGLGAAARKARIASGQNLPLEAVAESPLAKLGVPPAAVPAAATAATVGLMSIWPFLMKTVTGLLKSLAGSLLKRRAKKKHKVDKTQKAIGVMGFNVRPAELGSLLVGALIYGLAVCYTFQGRHMKPSFLLSQEALVIVIYYSRSAVRFVYERAFHLTTQYKFWPGGGLLCLASAFMGTTLGTVGFELEDTSRPEDAERIVKMKAWLIAISIGMALAFFTANILMPAKILQSGRVMMSGMALAEVLPINPMPGLKIYKWKRSVWLALVVVVVPTFVLVNFVL